jgi:hypothetical protein
MEHRLCGVTVEMEDFDDDTNQCWVRKTIKGEEYGNSLALVEFNGGIVDDYDNMIHELTELQLEKITDWAIANGY